MVDMPNQDHEDLKSSGKLRAFAQEQQGLDEGLSKIVAQVNAGLPPPASGDELRATIKRINNTEAPPPDPINPAHYRGDRVMRIIEEFDLDFPLGNAIKYILRHAAKAGLEDLKKAKWYLDRKIAQLEGTIK